jgi:hypothetical protein
VFGEGKPSGQDTEGHHDGTQDDREDRGEWAGATTGLRLTGDPERHVAVCSAVDLTNSHVMTDGASATEACHR